MNTFTYTHMNGSDSSNYILVKNTEHRTIVVWFNRPCERHHKRINSYYPE